MSSDEEGALKLVKKRKTFFPENLSDDEDCNKNSNLSPKSSNEHSNDECKEHITTIRKSRIINNDTDSDSEKEDHKKIVVKRDGKKKFREKFRNFKNIKSISKTLNGKDSGDEISQHKENLDKISTHINLSVCDPDESDDEENSITAIKKLIGSKSNLPSVKAKPIRMSSKEAMANMQKIKSESNRMLREKEVSLPYHRPKALSLKDIMNRRKPAISIDGKTLPIKMNEEQLKHYAMMLEERQKEMMELCKSESDEDNNEEKENLNVNKLDEGNKKPDQVFTTENIAEESDMSYDQIAAESISNDKSELQIEPSSPAITNLQKCEQDMHIDKIEHIENCIQEKNPDYISEKTNNLVNTDEIVTPSPVDKPILDKENNESQMISLYYEPESLALEKTCVETNIVQEQKDDHVDAFSDSDDLNCDDLDAFIENTEIVRDEAKEIKSIVNQPKLTGAPGMVISLDDDDSTEKPTGVKLLKERFTYFAKLQNEEDMEKDREKKYKPGTQHVKLRQQLEEEIAEQRSLEWAKRLEEEKILKSEQKDILGDDSFEDIDKIEAKLEEEKDAVDCDIDDDAEGDNDEEGDQDEDLVEDDVDMTDKPAKRNPMLDDEAEESDDDKQDGDEADEEIEANGDDEESDSSSESEGEQEQPKAKKGRILKAFEDSDDEDVSENKDANKLTLEHNDDKISQDEELQLAQMNKSSEDLFPSQECDVLTLSKNNEGMNSEELGTFSILNSKTDTENGPITIICETQNDNASLDDIVGMCSGSFSQSIAVPTQKSQLTPSLDFTDDVVALCTGKFYDNQFVSQINENSKETSESSIIPKDVPTASLDTESMPTPVVSDLANLDLPKIENNSNKDIDNCRENIQGNIKEQKSNREENLLKSILGELDEPEYDKPKQYKFFTPNESVKKKLVIDSDDEMEHEKVDKKKRKKRKEIRALQISDDEEEELQTDEEYESDVGEKVYEYDSEENEVEVAQPKKRKMEFFENEAELTSEDEWAGSGDEDEAGLDRMEREEGDDDVFHQGKLQSELGQIHMREVLDQDKREVRLIQELLFEDADLGDGHRQRKFKWRNVDGEEVSGTVAEECDTQEEEFESEEMWRKQRHEREMFLKKMQENGEELNTSINRTTIIKANLSSRTMSNLIAESNKSPVEKECIEKKSKDIPSPKKPFSILKQNYHGSFLTRGRGALARLAALATPLVVDEETPKVLASARGNFVFTAKNEEPKVKKRKAETTVGTPQLIKKMKTEEYKKTLFEQLRD